MTKTAKECSKQYRSRIKQDPSKHEERKRKDRERKKKARKRQQEGMSSAQMKRFRAQEVERVMNARKRRTNTNVQTEADTDDSVQNPPGVSIDRPTEFLYTPQASGKALKKVMSALPKSPRKRKHIVEKLAKSEGIDACKVMPPRSSCISLSMETKKKVHEFYCLDEISYQAPGKKDYVTIREIKANGVKEKKHVQCRYLVMSLNEAHCLFLAQNPDHPVGVSSFCSLRPRFVKLVDAIPHNICLCTYHENVRLMLEVLKYHTDLKGSFSEFISQVVCDPTDQRCMLRNCEKCQNLMNKFEPEDTEMVVKFSQWVKVEDRVEKLEFNETFGEIFDKLKSKLNHFLVHTFVKRKQAAYFHSSKNSLDDKTVLIQVDFAENFALVQQNEIQSAHWSHSQCTIFTTYIWHTAGGKGVVIVSDCLSHTRNAVFTFLEYLLTEVKTQYPNVTNIKFFSDGAASQFKQKYLFCNLTHWIEKFGVNLSWNFFATSHGKGTVDGIGGSVKRSVWRIIRAGEVVENAHKFYEVAKQRNPNVLVKYISTADIQDHATVAQDLWKDIQSLPQTQSVHCIIPVSLYNIKFAQTSDSANFRDFKLKDVLSSASRVDLPIKLSKLNHKYC